VNVDGTVAIVTGGAHGIGAALARALAENGARVVVADLDGDGAEAVAASIGDRTRAVGAGADVSSTDALRTLIALAETAFGPVDLFCANAGIGGAQGLPEDDADWDRAFQVNTMAHVRAARLLLPGWLERGSGYFVTTASAAGLLTQVGAAPYAVTKHAAVAFAEWLSITYGDRGVRVSCLCPMGVNTNLLGEGLEADGDSGWSLGARAVTAAGTVLEPEEVAARVLEVIDNETFLILPHAEVLDFLQRKTGDYDRWLRGMRRMQAGLSNDTNQNTETTSS
jgi:NAD(P)-dependent dehydrogenase (short-subunit alcohol dehydrogenase family)